MTSTPAPVLAEGTPGPGGGDLAPRRYGLDVLRVLAICGVVAIHSLAGLVLHGPRGTAQWWVAVSLDLGSSWTIPVFVMISGALLLSPEAHAAGPAAFYRKRLARILPAMIVWHVVYLFVLQYGLRRADRSLGQLAHWLMDANLVVPFYFLWLIVGLYAVAPVLAAFLQDNQRRAGIFAAVALAWTMAVFMVPGVEQLLGHDREIHLGSLTMWWPFVGFFAAGWALRKTVLSPTVTVVAAVAAVGLLAEAVWQWGARPDSRVLHSVLPVSYVGTVVAAASLLIFVVGTSVFSRITVPPAVGRIIVRLSKATFGVFLVHVLILELLHRFLPVTTSSLAAVLATYVAVVILSFGTSLALAKVPYVRTIV